MVGCDEVTWRSVSGRVVMTWRNARRWTVAADAPRTLGTRTTTRAWRRARTRHTRSSRRPRSSATAGTSCTCREARRPRTPRARRRSSGERALGTWGTGRRRLGLANR
eukprot:29243-Pelagococcus_subviridis.AAC.4